MIKYCFTYDAIKSEKWNGDELKIKITGLLLDKGAVKLTSPTASTILFGDTYKYVRIGYWHEWFRMQLGAEIFYYICCIARNKENVYIDRAIADKDLAKRFEGLVERNAG